MKDIIKAIITGLVVLLFAALPASLFYFIWSFAMAHIPVAEHAARMAVTILAVIMGGLWTFVAAAWGASLSVLFITAAE